MAEVKTREGHTDNDTSAWTEARGASGEVAVRLENISKTYPGTDAKAVDQLSLDICQGEVVTLLGPSGCGKTTTMRMVAGLEDPDEGAIYFGDQTVVSTEKNYFMPPEKRDVGMMFQSYAIWPHMTVRENLAFPLKARKFPRSEIEPRIKHALKLVGMEGYEDRPGPKLSGGQQQRIAMARAIVTEPHILLLDEPFSNLDAKRREQMRREVKMLQKRLDLAVLFVTHDQIEALSLSTRVVLINAGVVQQIGPPRELYERPVNEFVRDFIGQTLLFNGRLDDLQANGQAAVMLDGGPNCRIVGHAVQTDELSTGGLTCVGIRPDDLTVEKATGDKVPDGCLEGRVETALFMGEWYEYQVEVNDQKSMTLSGDRHTEIKEEEKVWIRVFPSGHTVWKMK